MTADNYILQYFDGRGRGEAIRMLLAHVGAEYKDERIKHTDWAAYKPRKLCSVICKVDAVVIVHSHSVDHLSYQQLVITHSRSFIPEMPFGHVPVLIVNGHKIAQTTAILRYLANKYELIGKTPLDNAMIDMLGESIQDFFPHIRPWVMVRVGIVPGDAAEVYKENVVPNLNIQLPIFEKYLEDNGSGWFVGKQMTWLDIFAGEFFDKFTTFGDATTLDNYPKLKQLVERVHAQPNIKKYIEQRPKTMY